MPTITFTRQEATDAIYNSLCNSGPELLSGSGILMDINDNEYIAAKKEWLAANAGKTPCREDIWMEILKTGNINMIDCEDDDKIVGQLSIDKALEVFNSNTAAAEDVMQSIDENDGGDAGTAENILQYAIFGEIIYG